MAFLQRTAGNAAVARMLGRRTTVQRAEGAKDGGSQRFEKVSAGGHLALRGRQEAYASEEMFAEANARLAGLDRVAITLRRGTPVEVAGQKLYRVLPVFKTAAHADAVGSAEHEPVHGDDDAQRDRKRAAHQRSLGRRPPEFEQLNALALRVNKLLDSRKGPDNRSVNGAREEAMTLALKTVGGGWMGENLPHPERFGREGLEDVKTFLPKLAAAYAERIAAATDQEARVDELLITLPNDCQAAAQRLIGRPENGLGHRRERPEVGENHYIDLNGAAPDGWQNHFAAVIMRDGPHSLTYEAAANRDAVLQQGKSLGYFALYGAARAEDSFDTVIGAQNQEYAAASTARA
ncbi:hypothetical protein [Streptomyces benahoarensis]|uniref:Uncharacterized protein n=1 Tax=Streptomyces benahoarensis TaxID=2595054 RepID=A0A553YUK0_9ACTN|nr:hypothetical protein [Streptomyces benahoarensis]TSB30085.1 hypothetical protein FNJ62_08320 [Streptomyces benahoarensis]TSB32891.1 hypothetical protein FNZ23_24575 [Streptomyces benahoarensis]